MLSGPSKNIKSLTLRLSLLEENVKEIHCRHFKLDKRHLRTLGELFHSIPTLRPKEKREKGLSWKEKRTMAFVSVNGL